VECCSRSKHALQPAPYCPPSRSSPPALDEHGAPQQICRSLLRHRCWWDESFPKPHFPYSYSHVPRQSTFLRASPTIASQRIFGNSLLAIQPPLPLSPYPRDATTLPFALFIPRIADLKHASSFFVVDRDMDHRQRLWFFVCHNTDTAPRLPLSSSGSVSSGQQASSCQKHISSFPNAAPFAR